MDALAGSNALRNRDRVPSSSNTTSTGSTVIRRPASQRDVRDGASIGQAETQSPANIPRAFEGMLRNSTETGDIGIFSIKPSRLPPSLNTSRRVTSCNEPGMPRQSFQPYGVPAGMDDRRRLPSYNRDTTSELISMYEGPSRNSSRLFEEPDYRSYSMTQASSQTLSNHRSYTSLRSQPEGNALLQRPRSPFAYPTRLRRPGFRPSSPALTDGGGVDYRRRAEIDRMPYGSHNTSSPSSLYAHKRVPPPLSTRPEFNRSTPSLLNQASPTRRSCSPLAHPTNINSSIDYPRRNGPASINTSPARSTLSLTSTVNLRPGNQPASTTTTPGKVSTPLYYDYTEEFDVEDYSPPRTREPPPQFQIETTIDEGRPTAMEQLIPANSNSRKAIRSRGDAHRTSSSAESIQQRRTEAIPGLEPGFVNSQSQWPVRKASLPSPSPNKQAPVKQVQPQDDKLMKEIFRISKLGSGAQELNSHVAEVFGLPLSESFVLMGPKKTEPTESGGQVDGATTRLDVGRYIQQPSQSSHLEPSMSRDSHEAQEISPFDDVAHSERERDIEYNGMNQDSSNNPARLSTSQPSIIDSRRRRRNDKEKRASSLDFTSARTKRPRSSGFNSVDTGLTELAELISNLENAVRTESPENKVDVAAGPSWQNTGPLPTIPDPRMLLRASSGHESTSSTSALDEERHDNSRANTERQGLKQIPLERGRRPNVEQDCEMGDMPNFSHQISRRVFPRTRSPILAPKPISPARQMKLKNSVPQLMKALPPLPPYPSIQAVSPSERMTPEHGLPFHLCTPHTGHEGTQTGDLPSVPEPNMSSESTPQQRDWMTTLGSAKSLPTIPCEKKSLQENSALPPSPPRMKLKVRSTALGSESASSEENPLKLDQSYRADQDGKPRGINLPKFKLRITRASNSSQGTVRINRDSRDLKRLAGLRNPKDFFTPPAGIDNILRQVSRQIHTRKSSGNSSHGTTGSDSAAISNQSSANEDGPESVTSAQLPKTNQLNPSDVRSFFSDASSNIQGRHSLRKRLSNFRARIGVPYSSRAVAQSLEDISSRGQISPGVPRSPVSRSVPDLRGRQSSSAEDPPLRNSTVRQMRRNLREKLLRWLKETRSAIAARVRPRTFAAEKR